MHSTRDGTSRFVLIFVVSDEYRILIKKKKTRCIFSYLNGKTDEYPLAIMKTSEYFNETTTFL